MNKTYLLIILLFLLGGSLLYLKNVARKNSKQKLEPAKNIQNPSASNVNIADFSQVIVNMLEESTGGKIDFLYVKRLFPDKDGGYGYKYEEVKENGISIRLVSEDKAEKVYKELYDKVRGKGYLLFLTNHSFGQSVALSFYDVAVIKGNDTYRHHTPKSDGYLNPNKE
ncbi:MAG: hypothetical protein Q7R92_04290 [bacterium]|nr:hypothetical protein [bacterium]